MMMRPTNKMAALGCGLALAACGTSWAGWQTGARVVADSNVTRTVDGGTADQYLWAFLSYSGGGTGQERLDWAWTATGEGSLYAEVSEFDAVGVTVSPEALYHLSPTWTASAAPFLTLKGVSDADQSAIAFGLRLSLAQQLDDRFYSGEHYVYTDSRARGEEFSYTEHTVGAFLGATWTPRFWTELGYDFAHGDSFRTLDTPTTTGTSTPGGMGGMGSMGGQRGRDFGFELARETVDSHFLTATLGWNLSSAVTPYVGYTYRLTRGDLGSTTSHIAYVGLGYRF